MEGSVCIGLIMVWCRLWCRLWRAPGAPLELFFEKIFVSNRGGGSCRFLIGYGGVYVV